MGLIGLNGRCLIPASFRLRKPMQIRILPDGLDFPSPIRWWRFKCGHRLFLADLFAYLVLRISFLDFIGSGIEANRLIFQS